MKFALNGTEKWIIWKAWTAAPWEAAVTYWCVARGRDGCPFTHATRFNTWREAMDYATGAS